MIIMCANDPLLGSEIYLTIAHITVITTAAMPSSNIAIGVKFCGKPAIGNTLKRINCGKPTIL